MDLGLCLGLGGRSGFSPASLFAGGAQGGWYDPTDPLTLFQDTAGTSPVTAVGQSVARINDKSGRGNHLTQATAGSRPTYELDADGRAVLRFNGTSHFLAGTMPTAQLGGNLNKTMFFAGRHTAVGGTRAKATYGTPTNLFGMIHSGSSRVVSQWAADAAQAAAATTNREVWAAVKTGNNVSLNVNNVQVIAPTALGVKNITSNAFELGRFDTTNFFNGDFYGLIFIEGNPPLSEPTGWLAARAGVVL